MSIPQFKFGARSGMKCIIRNSDWDWVLKLLEVPLQNFIRLEQNLCGHNRDRSSWVRWTALPGPATKHMFFVISDGNIATSHAVSQKVDFPLGASSRMGNMRLIVSPTVNEFIEKQPCVF